MTNPLIGYVNSIEALTVYEDLRRKFGHDDRIFRAMSIITQDEEFPFTAPSSPGEYAKKHEEIEQYLDASMLLPRPGLILELIEELHSQLIHDGEEIHTERLRGLVELRSSRGFSVKLTEQGAWMVQWPAVTGGDFSSHSLKPIVCVVYERNHGQIVPWRVVEYIDSGLLLYESGAYAASTAIMTIAVEATLRDLLATRDYAAPKHGVSRVDVYQYVEASIDADGDGYKLTYNNVNDLPKSARSLASSAAERPVPVQVRRSVHHRKGRVDLQFLVPEFLLDHLSNNQVTTKGQSKRIGGLGEALSAARNVERLIEPKDLPPELDNVLKAVRNNLLHLSSSSFDAELPQYNSRSKTGTYRLEDFVKDRELVSAFIAYITRFVNDQYINLWKMSEEAST